MSSDDGDPKLPTFATTMVGTTGTAYNENRTKTNVATSLITITSAVTTQSATGTQIYTKTSSTGTIKKRLIMDKDNTYMVTVSNVSAVTQNISSGIKFLDNALRIR